MIKPHEFSNSVYEIRQHRCLPQEHPSELREGCSLANQDSGVPDRIRVWAAGRPPAKARTRFLVILEEFIEATYVLEFETLDLAKNAAKALRHMRGSARLQFAEELNGFLFLQLASMHWVMTRASDFNHQTPASIVQAA